jgi:hypothetical protein
MGTMGEKITKVLVKAGIPADAVTHDVLVGVMKLMEGAYGHGYDDGREDEQTAHKAFMMKVLGTELKGKAQ